MKKFDSDAALAVAEDAFSAGFKAAIRYDWASASNDIDKLLYEAWSEFEPSEDIKALVE